MFGWDKETQCFLCYGYACYCYDPLMANKAAAQAPPQDDATMASSGVNRPDGPTNIFSASSGSGPCN